jgi:hypothetical protein
MRTVSLFFLALAIIIGGAAYTVYVSFSEHRQYSRKSLDYYLLTPPVLSAISDRCMDKPVFIYSSADGPKPTITTMNCTINREEIDYYMKSKDFQLDNDGLYKNGGIEIQVTTNPLSKKVTSIVLIEQP